MDETTSRLIDQIAELEDQIEELRARLTLAHRQLREHEETLLPEVVRQAMAWAAKHKPQKTQMAITHKLDHARAPGLAHVHDIGRFEIWL